MKNGEKMKAPRMFTKADVFPGEFPRIFADRTELAEKPFTVKTLRAQKMSSGYGRKLKTSLMICYEGKQYPVWATCFSNASSLWFIAKGEKIYIS